MKGFHYNCWFGHAPWAVSWTKIFTSGFVFDIVLEWFCLFFKGTTISGSCTEMSVWDLPFSADAVHAKKLLSLSCPPAPVVFLLQCRSLWRERGLYLKGADVLTEPLKPGTAGTHFTAAWFSVLLQEVHSVFLLIPVKCLDLSGVIAASQWRLAAVRDHSTTCWMRASLENWADQRGTTELLNLAP